MSIWPSCNDCQASNPCSIHDGRQLSPQAMAQSDNDWGALPWSYLETKLLVCLYMLIIIWCKSTNWTSNLSIPCRQCNTHLWLDITSRMLFADCIASAPPTAMMVAWKLDGPGDISSPIICASVKSQDALSEPASGSQCMIISTSIRENCGIWRQYHNIFPKLGWCRFC